MNQNQPKDYFDSIIGSTNQVTGSTTSTTQPKDYFDSIVGSTNNAVADTTSSTNQPMDYFDTILANQKNTQKDVTGLGTKQAEDFNAQLANFKNANPVLKYKTFEKYRDQYQSYLTQRGYSTGQIDKLLAEFNEKADPRNQTSNFEYYVGDRFNDVMIGGGNLIGDALAAVPETLPIVGEWADKWEKEYKNAVRDWQSDLSAKNQIQKYLGDKAEEEALKNGANEFTATLANVKANPMQITSLLTQQTPQLLLGGAGTKALGAINAAGGMGRERSDIEEAYERTLKENPQQLLTLPEIQSRMAKGMTLEEAVNDAKTDYSDNLGHILMGGVIGASEALTPTGRFMRGVNRGVAGTLAKEVGQEAFQEGAEKLNSNDAVGYIDGKTQLTDGVIKNATLGGIAGFGTGIPTAIEAGLNRNRPTDDQPLEDQIAQNSQPQSEQTAQPQPTAEVNGQAVDNVLNARQFESEEVRKEYENELKSAIKEGSIQEAAKDNTAFGQLARDYLAQTGQTVEPTSTAEPVKNSENPTASQVENEPTIQQSAVQSEPTATIDESRLADYQLELESLAESNPTQTQWYEGYSRLQQAYPEFEQFNTELNRRFVENSQDSSRYSRSAMKSVDANIARGRERMTQAILEKADVKRGMYRPEFGWIDFVWGDDGLTKPRNKKGELVGKGISHIIEARMRKDDMSYSDVTKMLTNNIVETIAKGEVKQNQYNEKAKENRIQLEYNGHRAVLIKKQGNNGWVLTAFELYQDGGQRVGFDTTEPTHSKPTLTRQGMGASDNLPVGGNSQLYDKTIPTQTLPTRSRQGLGATGTDNVQQSAPQSNPQIAQDQATLSRILGEDVARHIEVVDRNSQVPSGKNIKKLVTQGVEGWFESSSQKLYLISDNIEANGTFSRDERLAWVAWHELAHKGVRIKFGKILTNLLNSAGKHPTVKAIAQRIQAEYKRDNIDLSHEAAVEEAMMELFSAKETGNWQALADRYQVQIPLMVQRGSQLGKYFAQFANHFRRLIRTVLKRDIAMSDREVFETLQGIKQGIDQFTKNPQNPTASKGDSEARYSLNERADSDFAKAIDQIVNGEQASTKEIVLGTTPDVLKMLGVDDVQVVMHARTLQKDMMSKHRVSPVAMKQLPIQMNNPVAVMRSQADSTNPNAYLVLTELVETEKGKDKPIIAALSFKTNDDGKLELINVASAYGRRPSQISRDLENVMYWNKAKGEQLLNNFSLLEADTSASLRSSLLNADRLNELDIKTEDDLSQYQSENSASATDNNSEFSTENDDIRVSRKSTSEQEFANAVPKRTASSYDEARAIVSELLGEPLTNKATGMVATISKRSLEKMVSGKASKQSSSVQDHLTAVANIDQLFENAVLGWTEPHKTDDPNIANVQRLFAPLLIDNEMKLAKVTIKAMNFGQGNRIYTVETIEIENGTLGNLEARADTNQLTSPQSADVQSLIQRIADFNSQSENSANDEQDTRYSRKQSIENLTKTGKAEKNDKTLGDWFKALPSNINTALEDSLRPVVNWVKSLETVEPHIQEQILGEMYRAAGLKDNYRMDLEQRFVKPIIKDLAELGKKYKKLDNLSIKRLVGIYASLKWSIRKNELLLKADAEKMNEAKQALDEALQNGSQAEIDKADIAYRRAKRTYEDRQKDVKNTQFGEAYADVPFLVGTAGGWSIPEARAYMANIEQHIAKADIEKVLNKLYDLQQAMLDIDAVSQRYTPEQLAEYRKEPLYVPLTGDNDINAKENAFIGGAGRTAVNIASDKALKGRKLSEAEDAFDAVMKAIGKTTTYASWQPFKQILSDVYETEVQREIGKGKTMSEAKQIAEDRLGISKSRLQGITRPSDGKLIFKESGIAYEMGLPEGIMEVLKEETVERPLNALRFPSYLTRLMAQGVTQLTYDFPFVNMLRDTMDKADMIKDRTIYDQNGNPLSQEAKNKIGNQIYLHAFNPAIGKATGRFAFGKALGNSKYEKNLKRLAELGGLSTFTSELARTEKDFVKLVKKEGSASAAAGRLLKNIVVGWSGSFDFISATATFTSLIENGVDEKQAAALTLDLANFRKTGKMTRSVKGLFMFMQAKMMGAAQLIRDTEKS